MCVQTAKHSLKNDGMNVIGWLMIDILWIFIYDSDVSSDKNPYIIIIASNGLLERKLNFYNEK